MADQQTLSTALKDAADQMHNGTAWTVEYGWDWRAPMRSRVLGPALACTALLVTGCSSGEEEPTTAQAAEKVTSWMTPLEPRLTKSLETLQPWEATADASKDQESDCEDGRARRTYTATLDVSDATVPPDADNREVLLVGQLGREGWELSSSSNDDTSGTVTVKRAKADPTGTKLSVDFAPVDGGWRYAVTARTACLPTG